MFWFSPLFAIAATVIAIGIIAVYHVDDAFKYKIQQAKKNAVDVGIFNSNNELIDNFEIQSDDGVSEEVRASVNQVYYI
jgi:VCBS repeat-containing protein